MSRLENDCEERDQAAAYVLSALDQHEADGYREHLASCSECSAEVVRLQPVADSLATSVSPVVASDELR